MRATIVLITVALSTALAADNRPASSLTVEERQAAYSVAINQISGLLKAPATAQFTPIEQAMFSTGKGDSIDVRITVDAQNSFGAMLRKGWQCRVHPQRPDGLYPVLCIAGQGFTPKDRVIGLGLGSADVAASPAPTTRPKLRPEVGPPLYVPPPPASTPAANGLLSVHVESTPTDATIEVEGYPAGKTPADVKLERGEYILKISKPGYRSSTQKITVEPGKVQTFGVSLAAMPKPVSQ